MIGNAFGLPDGTSYMWINFFGPDNLVAATRNGEPMNLDRSPTTEAGWHAYEGYEILESGDTATYHLEFELAPADETTGEPVIWTQPLARRTP